MPYILKTLYIIKTLPAISICSSLQAQNILRTMAQKKLPWQPHWLTSGDILYHTKQDISITFVSGSDTFKTITRLAPALGGGLTLAPGSTSPVLQFFAKDINASRTKELIDKPDRLYIEPAYYEMENVEGLNLHIVRRWLVRKQH